MTFRGHSNELDMNCEVYKPSKAVKDLIKAMSVHLILKHKYYDAIDSGDKVIEYRNNTKYWRKRIIGRKYYVIFHKGYTNVTMMFDIERVNIKNDMIEIHLGRRIT